MVYVVDTASITKAISTGMGPSTKVLHKEELGVSEVERRVKRRVNEKIQQQQQKQEGRVGRKTSPSPREKPTSSPPSKVSSYKY